MEPEKPHQPEDQQPQEIQQPAQPPEALLPGIAAQMRAALSNLHLAALQLAPPAKRDEDPELDQRAAVLDQSYYRLLRLVNNLTAAQIFQKQGPLPLRDLDIVQVVGDLCDQAEGLAGLLGLTFAFHCRTPRHMCAANREGVEQLLYQLLSNAFKFTPAGGSVTVELKCAGGRMLLSVTDTGRGIPPEQMEVLFERYRHPERIDPQPHGLGLGLPLCARIAEGLGGRLLAESQPGKGSRFTLSFPDRLVGSGGVSDVAFDYAGGFNRTLLALSDALPPQAFLQRNLD